MNAAERISVIMGLRSQVINGKIIYLKPLTRDDSKDIVTLRNKPRNRYFFSQNDVLTVSDQNRWFNEYDERNDDIYWGVYKKENDLFIGTIRLYGIDPNGEFCDEGSYMIDEGYAAEAPYAVESKMLALDVAFGNLQIKTMINDNRADNKVMNSMDDQLGFEDVSIIQIRGVDYWHKLLTAENYYKNRTKFSALVEYWSAR